MLKFNDACGLTFLSGHIMISTLLVIINAPTEPDMGISFICSIFHDDDDDTRGVIKIRKSPFPLSRIPPPNSTDDDPFVIFFAIFTFPPLWTLNVVENVRGSSRIYTIAKRTSWASKTIRNRTQFQLWARAAQTTTVCRLFLFRRGSWPLVYAFSRTRRGNIYYSPILFPISTTRKRGRKKKGRRKC